MTYPFVELVFDSLKIISSLALVLSLSLFGRRQSHLVDNNWYLILFGFALLTCSFTIDLVSGLIDSLDSFVSAALETVFAFSGMGLAAFGLGRWYTYKEFAFTDRLTGLKNRLELERCVPDILAEREPGHYIGVLFIDLDGFKRINDNYGHSYGDALLKGVAKRFKQQARSGDKVFRLGGDEFVIVLEPSCEANPSIIAEQYLNLLRDPFEVKGKLLTVTASIGLSVSPHTALTLESLLEQADKAMYQAKRQGKNQLVVYADQISKTMRTQEFHTLLFDALENKEFYLDYQPVFTPVGEVRSLEVLIRWRKSTGEMVSPADFIPQAEASGFIVPLGEWLLQAVCQSLHLLNQKGYGTVKLAVNVSGVQLADPAFKHQFEQALKTYGVSAGQLEIEVTEGVAISPQAIEQLMYLKRLGASVAMDDFGTGYSSLGSLHKLPFDIVKIDKAFVNQLGQFEGELSLAGTIITLAHQLGKQTIAEGVEREAQLNTLTKLGCDLFQGYYFSKPLSFEQVPQLLDKMLPLASTEPEVNRALVAAV